MCVYLRLLLLTVHFFFIRCAFFPTVYETLKVPKSKAKACIQISTEYTLTY